MRQMAIGGSGESMWIALLEKGRLVEWRNEKGDEEAKAGEIYQARVTDVLPAIQSAFVDLGQGKKAYLYVDDAPLPREAASQKPSISERIHEGEKLLVQISKEATDGKSPKVTAQISLQGRYLVYLPQGEGISISRKVRDSAIRERLQSVLRPLLLEGEGVIVRTEAAQMAAERVAQELSCLRQTWKKIEQTASASGKPGRISREGEWIEQALLDYLPLGLDEVLVEDAAAYQQVKSMIARLEPGLSDVLRRYQGKESLASVMSVDVQLQQALQRQVPLAGGGFLVIDQTEAMTVIDVNTGSFTGKGGQQREQAVTATNVEAAAVIAAQLRLRGIGGIILIDFIDMKESQNKERLLSVLRRELSRDPVPSAVLGMTALGLVEMTRKRVRPSLAERIAAPCEACKGSGRILSAEYLARVLWDELKTLARQQEAEAAVVEMPTLLYRLLFGEQETDADHPDQGDSPTDCPVILRALHNPLLLAEEYRILYAGRREEADRLFAARLNEGLD